MSVTTAFLTKGYGNRRHTAHIIAVVHQTAVAGYDGQAMVLRNQREAAAVPSNSATFYVDPDGDAVWAVDGTPHYAWGQGLKTTEWDHLDTSRPSVAIVRQHLGQGFGVNECVWETIEGCGSGNEPWTDQTFETAARIIADRAKKSSLPINRDTVIPHRDLNTVDRPSDPWPADRREARMTRLITRANELLNGGTDVAGIKIRLLATADASSLWTSFVHAHTAKACGSTNTATRVVTSWAAGVDLGYLQKGELREALGPWPVGTPILVANNNLEQNIWIAAECQTTAVTPPTSPDVWTPAEQAKLDAAVAAAKIAGVAEGQQAAKTAAHIVPSTDGKSATIGF